MSKRASAAEAVSVEEVFNPAAAILDRPPALLARAVSISLCALIVIAIVYTTAARMDVVISGMGRVVPSGKTLLVQAQEAGLVASVPVPDGTKVKAGDVLLTVDINSRAAAPRSANTSSASLAVVPGASQALLDARLLETLSKLAALDAELARRRAERDAVQGAIVELEKSLVLISRKHAMRESLAKTGHMPQSNLIDSNLELINLRKELYVQQNRLQETEAAFNAAIQSRTQAETDYKARYPAELVEVVKRHTVENIGARKVRELRSPAAGVVRWLVPLMAGDAIANSQNLMVIVPEEAPLEVEALVFNKDIGHLRVGQRAIVKIETYDYTRYGHIEGTVQWVGVDAVTDPKLGPVYSTRISLDSFETPNSVNGRQGKLVPGMNVTTDVRVAERRMIEYFLSPLLRYKEESLRER